MTNEEALKWLDEHFTGNLEAKVTISKALEKQILKKVTHEATLLRCCTCPSCKNVIDEFTEFRGAKIRVEMSHCQYCGQRIDWSDEQP